MLYFCNSVNEQKFTAENVGLFQLTWFPNMLIFDHIVSFLILLKNKSDLEHLGRTNKKRMLATHSALRDFIVCFVFSHTGMTLVKLRLCGTLLTIQCFGLGLVAGKTNTLIWSLT